MANLQKAQNNKAAYTRTLALTKARTKHTSTAILI